MFLFFFFQAEDGIRDLVRSRGLGDVYKRQLSRYQVYLIYPSAAHKLLSKDHQQYKYYFRYPLCCLLYTSDAADERSSVDLGGRRIIKKKTNETHSSRLTHKTINQTETDQPTI